MHTYHDMAKDLRVLADLIDNTADRLPSPQYPDIPLRISIGVNSRSDVTQAANALGVDVTGPGEDYPTATVRIDTVEMDFTFVERSAMRRYNARQAYADTMTVSS